MTLVRAGWPLPSARAITVFTPSGTKTVVSMASDMFTPDIGVSNSDIGVSYSDIGVSYSDIGVS